MKKIGILIGLIIVLMLVPVIVNADMSMPEIVSYQVRVSNINGITLTDSDDEEIKLDYDTILDVVYEFSDNGEEYAEIELDGYYYSVKLSDIETISTDIDLSKYSNTTKQMYVYKEGAYLYNGPSKLYGMVDGEIELPVGTTITLNYYDDCWGYVEYNGISGWVWIYTNTWYDEETDSSYYEGSSLCNIADDSYYYGTTIYTLKDITLVNSPIEKEQSETDITIPAGVEIEYTYYYNNMHDTYYYLSYNGMSGWFMDPYDFSIAFSGKGEELIAVSDTNIYQEVDKNSDIIGIFPTNEEIEVLYKTTDYDETNCWYQISYNGLEGWVYSGEVVRR